jgi:hypothetical protein
MHAKYVRTAAYLTVLNVFLIVTLGFVDNGLDRLATDSAIIGC